MEQSTFLTQGTSGAELHFTKTTVVKKGAPGAVRERLNAQCSYMLEVGFPMADITHHRDGEYGMWRMRDLPFDNLGHALLAAKTSLRTSVWSRGATSPPDENWKMGHRGYVRRLLSKCGLAKNAETPILAEMRDVFSIYDSVGLETCLTHGDATIDNALMDWYGRFRWVDPIPPSPHLPSFKAADLGKLLQSATGYEYWKSGHRRFRPEGEEHVIVLQGCTDEERYAAKYFRRLAFLRMLPYTMGTPIYSKALKEVTECSTSLI